MVKLCFSTLGCTERSLAAVLALAEQFSVPALEIRGLDNTLDNAAIAAFRTENAPETRRMFAQKHIKPHVLGTSCSFHNAAQYAHALEEGKNSLRIAKLLGFPYIRVFGNNLTEDRDACIARVADGLRALCSYGEPDNTTVLLEVHGDFNTAENLNAVLERIPDVKNFGLIWDIAHTRVPYGERWPAFYRTFAPYILHVHFKDYSPEANSLCLPGDGCLPILPVMRQMLEDGYDGYFSLEWERKWHPELPVIEEALACTNRLIQQL